MAAAQVRRCAGGPFCACVCPWCSPPSPGSLRALMPQGMRVSPGRARAEGDGGGGVARYVVRGCHRTAVVVAHVVCVHVLLFVSTFFNSVVLLLLLCGGREGTTTRYVHALLPCFPSLPCSLSPAFLSHRVGAGRCVCSLFCCLF